MVYRLPEDRTRHAAYPLRLGPAGTDEVVEAHRIACSHFDAYRFFTAPARPLNTLSPGRARPPGVRAARRACTPAWTSTSTRSGSPRWSPPSWSPTASSWPATSGSSTCARRRTTCPALGYEPVRIETPEGKREYAAAQRGFAERGAPLRARLVEECARLLAAAG